MLIHLRLNRDHGGANEPNADTGTWRVYTLPSPQQAGINGQEWSEASVSAALQYLQRTVDPALAYSLSCRRGLCNVCAMRIDGEVRTACTTPMRDGIRVEPAHDKLHLRDTVVELSLVRKARAPASDPS
jgi:succinate dehydrogenase/fumarate reductase-like Fe-S protein